MSANATAPSTALIDYDAEFARIAEETRNSLVPVKGNFISTKGKLFTFPSGPPQNVLDCIVLDYICINQLMTPYNPNVRGVTKCWAMGRDSANLIPSDKSPQRQAENCTTCAMNQYGSATNGGKGKACANTYRLAVVPPDATLSSDIWLLKVSPTSLKKWTNYARFCNTTVGNSGFCRVITRINFDPSVDYPSLAFELVRPIDNPEVVLNLRNQARESLMTEPSND